MKTRTLGFNACDWVLDTEHILCSIYEQIHAAVGKGSTGAMLVTITIDGPVAGSEIAEDTQLIKIP